MTLPPLGTDRARTLVARFAGAPVLIVGDVMLDRFIVGRVTRISPEAPVPVVQFASEHVRLGGAANVANNVAALGGKATLVGLVGRDAGARLVRHELAAAGIGPDGLVEDEARRTTEKVRIVTERNQQVARVDYEDERDASAALVERLIAAARTVGVDAKAVLVSDYLKGSITSEVIAGLLASRGPAAPIIVDPKIPHLACYAGASLVTPNHHEAEVATHSRIRTDEEARAAARLFRERACCDAVLITRGEHGMWLSSDSAEGSIAAAAREVSDVTGAGDTVAATLALSLAAGATLAEAAVLANHAAGVVVGKFGPATLTCDELLDTVSAGNASGR
jgi:D-glycero-beta-D-manno-heptose-7-phosphate kinase